jgi:hypothetical protein
MDLTRPNPAAAAVILIPRSAAAAAGLAGHPRAVNNLDLPPIACTRTPAWPSMGISVSMLNRAIFPRTRSLMRGWGTPHKLAA